MNILRARKLLPLYSAILFSMCPLNFFRAIRATFRSPVGLNIFETSDLPASGSINRLNPGCETSAPSAQTPTSGYNQSGFSILSFLDDLFPRISKQSDNLAINLYGNEKRPNLTMWLIYQHNNCHLLYINFVILALIDGKTNTFYTSLMFADEFLGFVYNRFGFMLLLLIS